MNVCGNCLRWWRHLKRGDGEGYADHGTCWLDGTRTEGDEGCGFHSNKVPPRHNEPMPPEQTDDVDKRHNILRNIRKNAKDRRHWNK